MPAQTPRPNRDRLVVVLVVALAVAAAGHALVRTASHGAAVGHDQAAFLSAAENLAAGNGLVMFNGKRLWAWPPFYSVALAAPIGLGGAPAEVGRWLNALAFGLVVGVVGFWLRVHVRSPLLIVGAAAVVAVSPDLNGLAADLRSDALFALLTLVALTLVVALLRAPAGRRAGALVVGAAVFAALAALTRYAGVVLILIAAPLMLARPGRWRARLAQACAFAVLAATPLALVAMGNDAGARLGTGVVSITYVLGHIRDVLLFWALPAHVPGWLRGVFWGWLGVAVAMLAALRWRRRDRRGEATWRSGLLFQPIGVFGAFVVAYSAFHCAAAWAGPAGSSYWEMKRFLAAIYAPLACLAALLGQCLLAGRRTVVARVFGAGLLLAVLLHIGVAARANGKVTALALRAGYTGTSYNSAWWGRSETINHLRAQPPPGQVFSTDHALLWWHSGLPASARRHQWLAPGVDALARKLQGRPDPVYFVWVRTFHGANAPYNRFIHLMPGWETVARLADGGVYRVPAGWRFDVDEWRARLRRAERWPS